MLFDLLFPRWGSTGGPALICLPQNKSHSPSENGLVGEVGLEPTRIATLDPKSSASAIPPLAHFSECGNRPRAGKL